MSQAIPIQSTALQTSPPVQDDSLPPQNVQSTAQSVRKLMGKILPYIIGLGILLVGIGWLYGFQAVVLPLTLGISIGVGVGIFIGVVCIKLMREGHRSPWAWFRQEVITKLEAHGIRDLVVAVAVSVTLAIMVMSPIIGGILFGAIFANHVVYKIFFPEERRDSALLTTEERLRVVEQRVRQLEAVRENGIPAAEV